MHQRPLMTAEKEVSNFDTPPPPFANLCHLVVIGESHCRHCRYDQFINETTTRTAVSGFPLSSPSYHTLTFFFMRNNRPSVSGGPLRNTGNHKLNCACDDTWPTAPHNEPTLIEKRDFVNDRQWDWCVRVMNEY